MATLGWASTLGGITEKEMEEMGEELLATTKEEFKERNERSDHRSN